MEKLKLILKRALAEGAVQALLKIGEAVSMTVQQGKTLTLNDYGIVDTAWIEELYKALFPREGLALKSEQLVRSQFNIVNFGQVYVIADPRPPRKALHLFFPPGGDLRSQDLWIQLMGKATLQEPAQAAPQEKTSILNPNELEGAAPPPPPSPPPPPPSGAPGATTAAQAVRAESTQTRMKTEEGTGFLKAQVVFPPEVNENRNKLALILSTDAAVIAKAKSVAEMTGYYPFVVDEKILFLGIMDRLLPKLVFLDEATPNFQVFLKKLYDMEIDKRSQCTIMMLAKTYATGDTKFAFSYSVNGIVNRSALDDLLEQTLKAQTAHIGTYKDWLALATKA